MAERVLNSRDRILVAAGGLSAPFTLAQLVVEAWRVFPEAFGLRGFVREHPDSNRVLCKVMGSDGLLARGLLGANAPDAYELTKAGRRRLRELAHAGPRPLPAPPAYVPIRMPRVIPFVDPLPRRLP